MEKKTHIVVLALGLSVFNEDCVPPSQSPSQLTIIKNQATTSQDIWSELEKQNAKYLRKKEETEKERARIEAKKNAEAEEKARQEAKKELDRQIRESARKARALCLNSIDYSRLSAQATKAIRDNCNQRLHDYADCRREQIQTTYCPVQEE